MDFSNDIPLETENVEYFETEEFNTSEQYDFTINRKKANEKVRLKLSDFYSDELQPNRDLLWRYLVYINLLRERDMNYLEYHNQCHEKLTKAIENAKIQIVQGILKHPLEFSDSDTFFDELETQIDIYSLKCIECLQYKINSSSVQITDSLSNYGPVVISVLSQLKTLTLRLMESKRRKLVKCVGKLLECMKEVGVAMCEARPNELKIKTFDLTSKMNDMQGRNDLFMQYRSNLMLRYLDQKELITELLCSSEAQSMIADPEFNFSFEFMNLLPFNGDFTDDLIYQNEFNRDNFDLGGSNLDNVRQESNVILEGSQRESASQFEFKEIVEENDVQVSNEMQQDYQIDTRALEMARSKASAILRRKRELQKKIQMSIESAGENGNI